MSQGIFKYCNRVYNTAQYTQAVKELEKCPI